MNGQSSSREEAAAASVSALASVAAEEEEGKELPAPVSFSGAANQQPGGAGRPASATAFDPARLLAAFCSSSP